MNEGGRDDDTSTELLDGHQDVRPNAPNYELVQEQGGEHADGAGDQDYEERTNSQSDVVLALAKAARDLFTPTANAMSVTVVSNRCLNKEKLG